MKGSRVSKVKIAGQAAKRMLKFMCVTCVHAFIRGISNKKSAENRQPQERYIEERTRERERCKQVWYILHAARNYCACAIVKPQHLVQTIPYKPKY